MVVYLIWICVCLGLVIIGLLIDRTWLNDKIKESQERRFELREQVGLLDDKVFELNK